MTDEEIRLLHVCEQNLQLARAHLETFRDVALKGDHWPIVGRLGAQNDRIVDELRFLQGREVTLDDALFRAIQLAGAATLIAGLIESADR